MRVFSLQIAFSLFTTLLIFHTAKAQSAKEVSLIAHLAQEARQPDAHVAGDTYLMVRIGQIEYVAELESGKSIGQQKTEVTGGGICGDYAEVSINLLDKNKQQTTQGSGQVLKYSSGKWTMVALSEGDYSCEKIKRLPKAVIRCLQIECN
ncbi:hypothetical protein IC229_03675 [Spirosoma sp. BT702]|uniref:Uncharacterized protein n=1 Tax=Spirosoma profusum TaxID=2771354 RepID=A0A926XXG5_9BACT|nr:hypothetical protein [Spirosoma profusum]MBD2699722.1 hypothetical protein [Spirosoma profusum]